MAKVTKTESVEGVKLTPAKLTVEKFEKEFNKQIKQAINFEVKTIADYNSGAAILAQITAAANDLKLRKDAIVKPIEAGLKALKAEFLPHETKLADVKNHIKACMDNWRNEENARAERERQRILNDKRIKNPEVREARLAVAEPIQVSNTRKVLRLKVTDIDAIPGEYFELNETKLKDALKGGAVVPGAELYYDTITVS
jgi:hypothetical protein